VVPEMKSSSNNSNKLEKEQTFMPVADWAPVDFLTQSLVELPVSKGGEEGDKQAKKLQNLLALLVKLPVVEVPGYKKRIDKEDAQEVVTLWEPLDFKAKTEKQTAIEENEAAGVSQTNEALPEVDAEAFQRLSEMQEEAERKLVEANETLEEGRRQAEELVNQAREQAAQMINKAQSQVDQIKKQAFDEGALEIRLQSEEQMHRIATMIDETQIWRQQILEQSEPAIIKMVQLISKKLFGNGFVLDPGSIEQVVGRAITESNRLGNLRIYINPEDHGLLLSLWQESDLVVNGQKILLIPSQNILRGGCFVEGEFGVVDSRVDVQLELLESELNRTLNNREQEKNKLPENEVLTLEPPELPGADLKALEQTTLNIGRNISEAEPQQSEENESLNDS
jgi:flagellar assembly protein FliH